MDIWNLFGWPSQFWLITGQIADSFGVITGIIALGFAIWGWVRRKEIKRLFGRRFSDVGNDLGEGEQFDGLIFTVSHEDLPKKMIDMTCPKMVGLVATSQSRSSAEDIAAYAQSKGIEVLDIAEIAEPDNPRYSRGAAKRLIKLTRENGLTNIAVDITGGKTPMSIGAFMAAYEDGVSTVYLKSEFDLQLKKPIPGTARLISISAA